MGLDIWFENKEGKEKAYFRKVNFIIKFLEDQNYQIENCNSIEIDVKDLQELKNRCNLVLEQRELGPTLLPTCSGFFFGNTEYNDSYFQDVQDVVDWLESEDDLQDTYLYIWY